MLQGYWQGLYTVFLLFQQLCDLPLQVHPKDNIHKQDNVVYSVQRSEECTDLYVADIKQPLHERMAPKSRVSFSGQDVAALMYILLTETT